jgi:hypothetical protein
MVDVATFLGADPDFGRSEMLEVLKFETQLANISLPREERRNATRSVIRGGFYHRPQVRNVTQGVKLAPRD